MTGSRHHPVQGIAWMAGAALCFSVSISLVRYLSDAMTTFEIVFLRQVFGLVFMLPWLARAGVGALKTTRLKLHGQRAGVGYAGMATAYYSVTLIPLADSVTLQFTLPLFTALIAMWLLGERVGFHRWAAIAAGFVGVLAIVRPGFAEFNIGMLLALAAAVFYGGTDTSARALASTDSTPVIMFYSFILQIPLAAVPALVTWTTPGWDVMPALLAFAITATGAQWCLTQSLSAAEASLVSPVLFLRLPFVAVIGYVFFAQTSDIWTWIGAAIIIGSTLAIARREATLVRAGTAGRG